MNAEIKVSRASGTVAAPTSKSIAHRLLICAALSEGESRISGITPCRDVLATVDCLRALGATVSADGDTYTVSGFDAKSACPSSELFCRESGSTLRFIIPIAALSGAEVAIGAEPALMRRPLSVYDELFEEKGLMLKRGEECIFTKGPLRGGEYLLRGDVSSQFISGLLFALPLTDQDSTIKIKPPFESRSYVDLTLEAMAAFGVSAYFEDELTIRIKGGQKYKSGNFRVEGDYSGAAFTDALNYIGSEVTVTGLNPSSAQGDRIYKKLFPLLKEGSPTIDISDCPDLAPILMALASALNGAKLIGTARLKIKESDRAAVMAEELKKLGASIDVFENSVTIKKADLHRPTEAICGHNDHRVVMSMAVLLSLFGGEIEGAEAIDKSYPEFFEDIKKLGIEVNLND